MTIYERAMINDIKYFQTNDYFVNMQDEAGKSLLHYAVLGSSFDVVNELIRKGIDIDLLDNENESAFFDCARKNKLELAKLLIFNNANLNLKNNKLETPFHLASSKGNKTFLQLLYENKALVKEKTLTGLYPVHYAILAGQIDIIKYLLKVANQSFLMVDDLGNTLLHYATQTTNDLMIYFLISEGLNVNLLNNNYETALFNAVRFGTKETVNALLNNEAYIEIYNKHNETPIDFTIVYSKYQLETLLTNYQMLPKYERLILRQKLTILTLNRRVKELEALVGSNYLIRNDRFNYSALDYANLYEFKEIIKVLKKFNKY